MMKCAGHGLVYNGIATSAAGALAIRCISCPHPDENLPEGWQSVPKEEKYVFLNVREHWLTLIQICLQAHRQWQHLFSPEKHQEVYPQKRSGSAYRLGILCGSRGVYCTCEEVRNAEGCMCVKSWDYQIELISGTD